MGAFCRPQYPFSSLLLGKHTKRDIVDLRYTCIISSWIAFCSFSKKNKKIFDPKKIPLCRVSPIPLASSPRWFFLLSDLYNRSKGSGSLPVILEFLFTIGESPFYWSSYNSAPKYEFHFIFLQLCSVRQGSRKVLQSLKKRKKKEWHGQAALNFNW